MTYRELIQKVENEITKLEDAGMNADLVVGVSKEAETDREFMIMELYRLAELAECGGVSKFFHDAERNGLNKEGSIWTPEYWGLE